MKHLILALTVISATFFNDSLSGCTGLMLKTSDGSFVHGRTLEFGLPVETSVAVIPRNYSFTGTTPIGKGLEYKAKYGAVGVYAFKNPSLMDGLNEKGLSVGTFYFPGYAKYTPITSENASKALSPVEFPNWILTQFETVDEVKKGISSVLIGNTVTEGWGDTPAPFHYIVYDKTGKSIVIEPLKGALKVYDNPIGVLTNSPDFKWHMTNLRNYINLSPDNVDKVSLEGLTLTSFGQGSGLHGLPGDFSPPSRFVRAAVFAATAVPSKTADEAIFQIFHILNQFDIPVGAVREITNGKTFNDYTLATVARDPKNGKYYFRTFEDQTIRFVDINAFDLNAKEIKSASTNGRERSQNVDKDLK